MKRAMLMVMLATSVMMIARAAQAPPNLSGTWRPQNAMSGQVNPFEFTITQAADSVTIRTPLNNPESVTLKLTGEETRTQIGGGRGRRRHGDVPGRVGRLQARGDVGGHRRPWRAGLGETGVLAQR